MFARPLVGQQMHNRLLDAVNARRRRGPSYLWWDGSIRPFSFTEEIVELVMLYRSVSRPASGRFAVNQWTQLSLTLSEWPGPISGSESDNANKHRTPF